MYSCSLVWQGKMHVFGGLSRKKQIARVDDCVLGQIGALDFNFKGGACTASRVFNTQLIFVFSSSCYALKTG